VVDPKVDQRLEIENLQLQIHKGRNCEKLKRREEKKKKDPQVKQW